MKASFNDSSKLAASIPAIVAKAVRDAGYSSNLALLASINSNTDSITLTTD